MSFTNLQPETMEAVCEKEDEEAEDDDSLQASLRLAMKGGILPFLAATGFVGRTRTHLTITKPLTRLYAECFNITILRFISTGK